LGIKDFKKVELGIFPTPLTKLNRLSKEYNCNIYIKRDDLCGVGVGGNKVRKLEFLLADALNKGCDTVVTMGGAQSNHAMLTAACARRLNLEPILFLKKRGVTTIDGNLLLNDILNTEVHLIDTDYSSEVERKALDYIEELKKQGKKPYFIPIGGSNELGTLGYINCTFELYKQLDEIQIDIDHLVCASGSGGTQGGLLAGTKILNKDTKVTGIMVSPEKNFPDTILNLAKGAISLLDDKGEVTIEDVNLQNYIGPGYAVPSKEGVEATKILAKLEGIFLDPVYTGKAFGGMLDLIKRGYIKENQNIVFIHTGGIPGLFAIKI